MLITSKSNPNIKAIRNLATRKGRRQQARFWVEGIRLVAEAAALQAPIEFVVVARELLTSSFALQLVADLKEQGVPFLEVTSPVFKSLSAKDGPQGLGAVVMQSLDDMPPNFLPEGLWVALAEVQDPGNLGSIMRTADAVGCQGLILLGNCTDPYDPAAVRGSMGSLFSLKLFKTDEKGFLAWQTQSKIPVVGTSGAAADHYRDARYATPMVLLSGSERQGLSPALLSACNNLVSIPMVGKADSLNLAVATSVVLYEIFAQVNETDWPDFNRRMMLKNDWQGGSGHVDR